MSPLDAGAKTVVADMTAELHRRTAREQGRPALSKGPVSPSVSGPPPSMARLFRLQALSLRVLLEAECGKSGKRTADKSTLERLAIAKARVPMSGGPPMLLDQPSAHWLSVPKSVAIAIACSRLPESERLNYAHFEAEAQKVVAAAPGDKGKRRAREEVERRRAVFLTRFFPVPEPSRWQGETPVGGWSPGFWSPDEYAQIEEQLRTRLRAIENPVEPLWWPDGWREAMTNG